MSAVARSNASYPLDLDFIPWSHKVDIKPVRVQQPNFTRNQQQSSFTHKPCSLCTFKGFEDHHYPLGKSCGAAKLSSTEIIGVLSKTKACPTCGFKHSDPNNCKSTFRDGCLKARPKGCLHDSIPLNRTICNLPRDIQILQIEEK